MTPVQELRTVVRVTITTLTTVSVSVKCVRHDLQFALAGASHVRLQNVPRQLQNVPHQVTERTMSGYRTYVVRLQNVPLQVTERTTSGFRTYHVSYRTYHVRLQNVPRQVTERT